jgi:hypothetical protein
MANKNTNRIQTLFQELDGVFSGRWGNNKPSNVKHVNNYSISPNTIIRTSNKEEYEAAKLQAQQNKYLSAMWVKANRDSELTNLSGLNNVKLMYRDAELMDAFPEIGSALDIYSEEATTLNDKGMMINIYSKSNRIKSILEDLFVNRLQIHTVLPMIVRTTCKYGNDFHLLNINDREGILGWRQLPVYEIERYEGDLTNPYNYMTGNGNDKDELKFVWVGKNDATPYRSWQVSHFRLLNDSLYLPYGVSILNKARRHWRILALMEDMMLIYRLERSIERRVYKINVGGIDDKDVPAYIQEIANNFKRTPVVDPLTGQLDLRKNILGVDQDIFVPVRSENAPNPIDTLSGAANLNQIEDLKFIQNKVLSALRVPKAFLNFEESTGDGKNLALMDIRFSRSVMKVQQSIILELTKIATIHLYLMGMEDELTNFTITMNNPSTQSEMMRIEQLETKIRVISAMLNEGQNGIQIVSWSRALKQVLGWTDDEIAENLNEIRLEHAIANELKKTDQIINRTGVFDSVDKIYGEPGSEYTSGNSEDNGKDGGSFSSIGGLGGGGSMSMEDFGTGKGNEGELSADEVLNQENNNEEANNEENNGEENNTEETNNEVPINPATTENKRKNKKPLLTENRNKTKELLFSDIYIKKLKERELKENGKFNPDILSKAFLVNEDLNNMINEIDNYTKNKHKKNK